jgi:hypothetical protein
VLDEHQPVAAVRVLDALGRLEVAPARVDHLDAQPVGRGGDPHLDLLARAGAAVLDGVGDQLAEHERHAVADLQRQAGFDRGDRATRDRGSAGATGDRERGCLRLHHGPGEVGANLPVASDHGYAW